MDGLFIVLTVVIISFLFILITLIFTKRKQTKKYKNVINELDVEKNKLIGVTVLSEFSKVKELVKTDNLKQKLEDWDNIFKDIKDTEVPKLNDLILETEFLVDKKEYK